ncbi:MAG: DNA polymerase III subunit delta [Candidatus Omnitrophica bacterium]|nr:DNA polymerase III subunit delta [Candidatus Omnitrophota bacterium]MBU1127864.1 DNA polymerase III subunit delta [Candidatus Omnitrophota bacterium]MBU1656936.1 DNA polymerase III subunit delta [Candidatus Omnitrophota bacterium]MBU1784170.1 DNA polymerase III subunit delta [Candidatus Omnitrophota bacterium]MBU1851373.1 DNA polymerase III subunit delta [Candidatus Omnitrophota bacterium]
MTDNYLIVGDDEYVRDREITKLKDSLLSADERDLNFSAHFSSDLSGLMNALGTMPFLSDKRMVLLKDPENIPEGSLEGIIRYLSNPADATVFVIAANASFKKSKFYKQFSLLTKVIEADRPAPGTMKKWVKGFFKKENIDISDEAVDLIVELKGNDTTAVRSELEKLACYSAGENIALTDVEMLVGRSVTEEVFKLVDAINTADAAWAARILEDLYDQKKQPTEIIGYLGWYVRIIQKIKLLSSRGSGENEIVSELGYSTGYARRLISQARKYSNEKIKQWVSLLLATDHEIKGGIKKPSLAMDMLISRFLSDQAVS